MSKKRTGFIGWHDVQEGMYYWKTCGISGHVLHKNVCYGRTCLVGGHVLQICAEVVII